MISTQISIKHNIGNDLYCIHYRGLSLQSENRSVAFLGIVTVLGMNK